MKLYRNQKRQKLPEYSYGRSLRSEEFRTYKRVGLFTLLTAIILTVLYLWGITFVNSIGSFWQIFKSKDKAVASQSSSSTQLPTPRIEPIPSAVNTDSIDVKGYSSANLTIKIYVNDSLFADQLTGVDGSFTAKVRLKTGNNTLAFLAVDSSGKESNKVTVSVSLDKTPPPLTLNSPPDGAHYGANLKEIVVSGKTDPEATIIINDFQAIVSQDGSFSLSLPLNGGANKIRVVAKDIAGNQTTQEITVQSDMPYTPPSTPSASPARQ